MKDKKPLDWIPIYIDKHLFGSTRVELEPDERSVWFDLLILSGKDSGFVRANEGVPYLPKQLAGMFLVSEELLKRTIEKCIKYGKVKILNDGTIYLPSWENYRLSLRHKRRFDPPLNNPPNRDSNRYRESNRATAKQDIMSQTADTKEKEILSCLKKVKNFPYEYEKTLKFIRELSIEFPNIDILEEIKKKCTWWIDHPLTKKSNPHLQLRNWFRLSEEFRKGETIDRQVGKASYREKSKEEIKHINKLEAKRKELQEKYKPDIEKAKKEKNLDRLEEIENKIKIEVAKFSLGEGNEKNTA